MTSRPLELTLEASFERLSATIPATVGIAIAAPGGAGVCSLGRWSTGVAWSTIKVPLAIAALRNDQRRARDSVFKAITESDNLASENLWSQLGTSTEAAQRLQAVIGQCGDTPTVVESRRIRPGFTAFGQTQWALSAQAQFGAQLPEMPDAAAVVQLMQNLIDRQRWGLAAKGFAAKGGWGPGKAPKDYMIRQFGIVPTESGNWGVALAAEAHNGAFNTAKAAVNRLADWLVSHLADLAQN
ncbi:MAG: hypothetical protein WBZ37_10340 [Mycobacterium sp.]